MPYADKREQKGNRTEQKMTIFRAWRHVPAVTDINADELKKEGIRFIVFDFDNTLTFHGSEMLSSNILMFLDHLITESFSIFILSNAKKQRMDKVLKKLKFEGRGMSYKPVPFILNKVIRDHGFAKNEVVLIGDQIFTDIIAGNLAKIKTILVERISDNESAGIKLRRKLESALINGSKKD
jgi:uncharacterized protein